MRIINKKEKKLLLINTNTHTHAHAHAQRTMQGKEEGHFQTPYMSFVPLNKEIVKVPSNHQRWRGTVS